jgi:hypothetical protein
MYDFILNIKICCEVKQHNHSLMKNVQNDIEYEYSLSIL